MPFEGHHEFVESNLLKAVTVQIRISCHAFHMTFNMSIAYLESIQIDLRGSARLQQNDMV